MGDARSNYYVALSRNGANEMKYIPKQIWLVKDPKREDLCYLTYVSEGKGFKDRQNTGRKWAWGYRNENAQLSEFTYDNTPVKGLTIEDFVSRYSTSNKLVRVRDPRGFVVEVSISDLVDLMLESTIVNGVVQEDIVWVSKAPVVVGSKKYMRYLPKVDKSKNMTTYAKLKVGDIITTPAGTKKLQFLGKKNIKSIAKIQTMSKVNSYAKENKPLTEPVFHTHDYGTKYIFKNLDTKKIELKSSSAPCIKVDHQAFEEDLISVLDNDAKSKRCWDLLDWVHRDEKVRKSVFTNIDFSHNWNSDYKFIKVLERTFEVS